MNQETDNGHPVDPHRSNFELTDVTGKITAGLLMDRGFKLQFNVV
jgi:hypothetical protein